jgi:hypothetical protein
MVQWWSLVNMVILRRTLLRGINCGRRCLLQDILFRGEIQAEGVTAMFGEIFFLKILLSSLQKTGKEGHVARMGKKRNAYRI